MNYQNGNGYNKNLGKILRLHRIRLRWSASFAAHQFGISSALLYKLEYGHTKNPTMTTLVRIADVLGVAIDELIGRTIPNNKPNREEKLPPYFLNDDFYKLK